MHIQRHPQNPIVVPGLHDYRRAAVFNPGVILHNGEFCCDTSISLATVPLDEMLEHLLGEN